MMDGIGHDQHTDAVAEVGQRLGQGLAVLATLGEAAARLAAEEMRRRAQREEHAALRDDRLRAEQQRIARRDRSARMTELRRAAQRDRRLIGLAVDENWLACADLLDMANVWRAARVREQEFPEARAAAGFVEERLREVYPRPMDLYDQAVANGASPADAMRVAAREMARTRPARPHGGRRDAAIQASPGPVVGPDTFNEAVERERAKLADGVAAAPDAAELERLGVGGRAAAQALGEALTHRAEDLRHGSAATATTDPPSAAKADRDTARDSGTARRTAAQLAAEWYPYDPCLAGSLPADVASKQPANVRTPVQGDRHTRPRTR